ncbi:hypothetical protein [Bdellovibrio sp. BCCA]|uniref:hypothetical protein n=1 Tax=Bdellovibrio sp. BCCA TaxID=3136281 RepID=UPI0030F09714
MKFKAVALFSLLVMSFSTASVLAQTRDKSCMEPCTSKSDFPYYSYTTTGLDYGYDLRVNKRALRGDVDVKLSLLENGAEIPMIQGAMIDLSSRESLVFIRILNSKYDVHYSKNPDVDTKLELKFSLVSGGRVLAAKVIPFATESIQDQFFVDDVREFTLEGEESSARIETELIAAGGMKCRWKILPPGVMYCDDGR